MPSRSRQAARMARELGGLLTEVKLAHVNGFVWKLSWMDGPTVPDMESSVHLKRHKLSFVDLRDRTFTYRRTYSPQAWAARAVASLREGTLAPAVAEGADHRRSLGVPIPREGAHAVGASHEYYALLQHVDELLEAASYPQRPSAPEDKPVVARLLEAGTVTNEYTGGPVHSTHTMAKVLLLEDPAVPSFPADAPAERS